MIRNLFSVIYLFLCFLLSISAQNPIKSHQIGNFSSAEAFSISQNQFIYVTDSEENEVYKLNLNGSVIKFIGGYGWSDAAFDNPVDVFATTLNVYVTDKNNDRIQFFDKDLNFISVFGADQIANPEYDFRYPTCAAISPVGDLYILDSDNSRILKFNMNGDFSLEIGSYDSGSYALQEPTKFDISSDLRIFVLDGDELKIFDQFGGGLSKIKINENAVNLQIVDNIICISFPDRVGIFDMKIRSNSISYFELDSDFTIKDSFVFKNQLFVLTENEISVYNLPKF